MRGSLTLKILKIKTSRLAEYLIMCRYTVFIRCFYKNKLLSIFSDRLKFFSLHSVLKKNTHTTKETSRQH